MLTFNEDAHEYRWHGELVPSVTTIIKETGCMPRFGRSTWHRDRGTAFHLAAELWDQGELDEATVDPAIVGHLLGYRRFREHLGEALELLEIEQPRYNEAVGYAGMPDRVVRWNGKPAIIDLKTGSAATWHRLQTAGYAGLLEGHVDRLVVYVAEDSSFKFDVHDGRDDWKVFCSAVAVWRWRTMHGLITGATRQEG